MRHASFQAMSPAGLVIDTMVTETDRIAIAAHPSAPDAACPDCGTTSAQVHSRYERRLLDLPSHGRSVHLRVQVRRFRCGNRDCQRRIFGEPLPDGTAPRGARRTSRLEAIVHHLGVALGGRPAASLARRLISTDAVSPSSSGSRSCMVKSRSNDTTASPVRASSCPIAAA